MKVYPSRIFRLVKEDSSGRYEWLHVFIHKGGEYILDHFMRISDGNYGDHPDPSKIYHPDDLRVSLQAHIDKYTDPIQNKIYDECTYTELTEEETFIIFMGRL